jgi:NodT family efflux transporter outer membrane factor (OMF) lipoprotein
MRRVLIIAACLAPLVAGCASNSKVGPADTRVPAAFEAPPAPDGVPEAAMDKWWTLYGDQQLNQLVEQALASGFDQETALARLEQAYFQRRVTRAALLPTGNLSSSGARSQTDILRGETGVTEPTDPTDPTVPVFTVPGVSTSLSASFNVSWEVDLFGRSRTGRRIANADYTTALYTYEATRTALAANVADSLFNARGLAIQAADAEETLRINQELEKIVRIRVEHGLAASSDLDQAVANTGQTQASLENIRSQLTTARRLLLLLVGKGVDPLATLPIPAEVGTPPSTPSILPSRLLERRPDVKQAQWALTSQLERHKLSKLALFPTLTLQPGATLTQTMGSFDQTSLLWSLGAGLTVPILDRPRLFAEIGVQRGVAEEFVVAYERAVQTAYAESENALVLLDSDRRRAEILRAAEARAEAAYQKKRKGYVLGVNDVQAALIAETTWRNLRIQRSAAEVTLMQRSVQLFKALGGGWSPEAPAASAPPTILVRGIP